MVATWTSDALGQFIGPAVEVEGGVEGGNPAQTPPPPPGDSGAELGKPGTPMYTNP
jgi:hypothetical protein